MQDLELPDPEDRHVLAAAIETEDDIILTWNLRDFPEPVLASYEIKAETPDSLLSRLFETRRGDLVLVLRQARMSLKQPPISASEYLESLRQQGLSRTCMLLQAFLTQL